MFKDLMESQFVVAVTLVVLIVLVLGYMLVRVGISLKHVPEPEMWLLAFSGTEWQSIKEIELAAQMRFKHKPFWVLRDSHLYVLEQKGLIEKSGCLRTVAPRYKLTVGGVFVRALH